MKSVYRYCSLVISNWLLIFGFTVITAPIILLIAKLISIYFYQFSLDNLISLLAAFAINSWILVFTFSLTNKPHSYIFCYLATLFIISKTDGGFPIIALIVSVLFMLSGLVVKVYDKAYNE